MLTYTIGQPGEIIITVITKNKAEIRYNYPIDQLLALKKVYTDKVKKIPAQLNPYMKDLQVDYKDGQLVRYASKQSAYKKDDFVFYPQQFGYFREIIFPGFWTFCFHPNSMEDNDFNSIDLFIKKQQKKFISFDEIEVEKLDFKSLLDKIVSFLYFLKRKI